MLSSNKLTAIAAASTSGKGIEGERRGPSSMCGYEAAGAKVKNSRKWERGKPIWTMADESAGEETPYTEIIYSNVKCKKQPPR